MKMPLTFNDRVALVYGLLPQFGTHEKMKLARVIKNKVGFTEAEKIQSGLKEVNRRLVGNPRLAGIKDIEVEFSEAEFQLIKENIELIDKQGRVQDSLLDTMDKFE